MTEIKELEIIGRALPNSYKRLKRVGTRIHLELYKRAKGETYNIWYYYGNNYTKPKYWHGTKGRRCYKNLTAEKWKEKWYEQLKKTKGIILKYKSFQEIEEMLIIREL